MNMKFLLVFVVLSIINVIFSTVRSIATIKSGKLTASLLSGGYFAFYNIMLIYTVANFPMWQKCIITFVCNVVGVWIVKFFEERSRKDKLWLVKMTVKRIYSPIVVKELNEKCIPYSRINVSNDYVVFDCYCQTQDETKIVTTIGKANDGKMFATENKLF